jgi:DNA replication initiation complex subunit (GINS family)
MKNINQQNFDDINAYHFQELNAEERTLFEAMLIINPDLSDEYESFKSVVTIIKEEQRTELLESFAREDKVLDKNLIHMSLMSKLPLYLLIAAIIAVFIAVFYLQN